MYKNKFFFFFLDASSDEVNNVSPLKLALHLLSINNWTITDSSQLHSFCQVEKWSEVEQREKRAVWRRGSYIPLCERERVLKDEMKGGGACMFDWGETKSAA